MNKKDIAYDSDDESVDLEDEYDDNIEAWADVDGYKNYMVSTFGNVHPKNVNLFSLLYITI